MLLYFVSLFVDFCLFVSFLFVWLVFCLSCFVLLFTYLFIYLLLLLLLLLFFFCSKKSYGAEVLHGPDVDYLGDLYRTRSNPKKQEKPFESVFSGEIGVSVSLIH